MENHKHKLLKQVALRWVQKTGCVVFATEVQWHFCGIPDAVGMKADGGVYIVEAKDTTSDLRSDFKPRGWRGVKPYVMEDGLVIGSKLWKFKISYDYDFLYYIVSDCVDTSMLPKWVGIIDERGRVRRNAKRRQKSRTEKNRTKNFETMARKLSWKAFGHVIRGEQEQPEFSLTKEVVR